MTDPVSVAVALAAAGLAVAAGVLSLPRPPELDGERWFKVMLATLWRGRVEAEGGDAAAWEAAVRRSVPYHPAGRLIERKLTAPAAFAAPGTRVAGEPDLLRELAALPDAAARWGHLFETSEVGLAARLGDPAELGPAYDPARALGATAGWEDLADWGAGEGEALVAALARRGPSWVIVGDDGAGPSVLDALARRVPGAARVGSGPPEVLAGAIAAAAGPTGRIAVAFAGDVAQDVLRALVAAAGLRDRLAAVVSVGGNLGGRPGADAPYDPAAVEDWMGAWFTDRAFDLEARRRLPCFCLQWIDLAVSPPGHAGLPVERARFPSPRREAVGEPVIEIVDLGVLPPGDAAEADLVARALWALVTAYAAARA